MAIEDVFSSKGRVKILKILAEIRELNISEIARRAGLNYTTTNQHLQVLENHKLVRHKTFGRIRIFRFDEENPRAKMIKDLIEFWEETNNSRSNNGIVR
jgi:DNA-binding transcriptional ArsR family regulator